MIHRSPARWRLLTAVLLAVFLTSITLISLGSAFRDNDQAALLSGGLQLIRGQMSPLHAMFYNYDKQWGSYWLIAGLSLLTPAMDPVLRGNVLQVALLLPAMILSVFVIYREKRVPIWTFLPLFLSPALVLYLPFLATASLSLAFVFLSFALLRSGWKWSSLWAIAAAAACRGDVVLIVPVMVLSTLSRRSFLGLIRSKFAWLAVCASVAPVLFGKVISGIRFSDLAGFSFSLPLFAGFLTFGLGLSVVILLAAALWTRIRLILTRRRWRLFYSLELLALLLPIGFYWAQLYSPRYFFLTLIGLLFFSTTRRSSLTCRGRGQATLSFAVLALVILPWLVGLSLPSLKHLRLTFTEPTIFPTADGAFPMGAYGEFAVLSALRDHLNIDHNQKIWVTARSVDFQVCNGMVPVMGTPMSYYMDLAIRLQNKTPARITDITHANVAGKTCGGAYADLRAIIRHDSAGMDVARTDITVVSRRADLGRPIVWIANGEIPSGETESFRELEERLRGKDAEVFFGHEFQEPLTPGTHVVYFSYSGDCQSRIIGTKHLCAASEPEDSGYAQTIFPDYISK